MGGDTSAVKKKHDWNPMADKSGYSVFQNQSLVAFYDQVENDQ